MADEVFVYERAGDTAIPVIDTPPETGLTRDMSYWISGQNGPDDTGLASTINGTVRSAPGQQGYSRIRITTRDGASANPPMHFTVQFSNAGAPSGPVGTLTIVDDDGVDPILLSSGARPFDEWPALFSSVTTLFSGATPSTAAIGDIDGDGRNDVAVSFDGTRRRRPAYRCGCNGRTGRSQARRLRGMRHSAAQLPASRSAMSRGTARRNSSCRSMTNCRSCAS